MKTSLKIAGTTYTVTSKMYARGVRFPGDDSKMLHNKFRVTLTNGRDRCYFDFYGSGIDYDNGVIELDDYNTKNAISCFISDAVCGGMSFEEFCSNLGYDSDSRKSEKVWKSCQKSWGKAIRMFDDIDAAYESITELTNA